MKKNKIFLPEHLGRRNRNSKSSSDFDSDYEPPDYVQDEILEENSFYTRSMTNQLQKEEALKRILENKINRYPLRQYLNLGTGFDIHLRPNYQESDLEEEYERKGRRRHSISAPFSVEDEEENEKKSNLKIKVRRCSEGYLGRKENENIKEASTNFQDSVSITRTLTYTSKKQIIKLYQTELLNDTPANSCELQDIVNKFKCGIEQIDNVDSAKNNKYAWFKEQPSNLLGPAKCSPYKNRSNKKEMEIMYRNVQKQHQKEKVNTYSTSNTENYFFAQLGLKRQAQTKKNYTHLRSKLQLEKKNGKTRTNKCKNITKKSKSCSKNFTPFSEPFSFQNNKHQLYNMGDLEYKLKCLFGKEENKKLQEERINVTDANKNYQFLRNNKEKCHGKTSDLEQAKFKVKRSQYCYLHKQKVNFRKIKREQEKLQSRKEMFRSLKPTENIKFISQNTICSLNKEVEVRNIRKKIETLKEKRRTLFTAKMVLKKILCSKETCVRASNSLPNTFRGEINRYESEEKFQNRPKRNSNKTVEMVQGCCLPPAAASSCSDVIDSTIVTSTAPILNDREGCVDLIKPCSNDKINNVTQTDKDDGTCPRIFLQDMFPDESEEDQDLRDLIATLADSIDTSPSPLCNREVERANKSIDNNSHNKLPTDAQLDMTGMEHYKKRLIHQHEKPGGLSSPCTTTEEEDDSLESPLSPTSSVQSRESIQQDKRRDDVVQKVARKRAVCRSQFRHQNMELFKLGSSIPTSLCKTKEPYNVCTGKNLQMCYQNGGTKKCDKNPSKGSLTESIISTIEGGKRKDVPLWRSVSLNNEISEGQNAFLNTNNADNKNLSSGRHILPAIVPELPERRKSRIKSLPESGTKNNEVETNNKSSSEALSRYVYEFVDNDEPATRKTQPVETITKKPTVKQKSIEETRENESFTETHAGHANNTSVYRHSSTSSESDIPDCAPINLSLKKRETVTDQATWTELFNVHQAKRGELNNNQHLTQTIPKQPSNVPKKPVHVDQNFTRTVINENLETSHVDKDGNCFFVTAIPSNALDPQKQSNVIVINFPHIQQQMSRMEKPNVTQSNPLEAQQSPLEMLDSAIMSLINIVKSSVESVFNILSLPVLNRLYIDLNRYMLLPTVSVKMKACIEDALNALISYLLVNLFRAPRNSKARDFVHKILQLDLRPHMDFLINSLDIIQQKIKYEYFMDHLLKVLSRNPQEDFAMPLPGNMRRPFGNFPNVRPSLPPSRQYFSNQNQVPEFRDYPHNRFWMENQVYQHGNVTMPNAEYMGNVPQNQPHRRNRRQHQESDQHLGANMRIPENFNEPNLAMMRPDLYLADNRCIPPNISHIHSEAIVMNTPSQLRVKGRPRNSNRINKIPNKLYDNSLDLPVLPQVVKHRGIPEENQIIDRRERDVNIVNSNVSVSRRVIRRNSDIPSRDTIEDTIRMRNGPQILENRRLSEGTLLPSPSIENGANLFSGNNLELITRTHEIHKNTNRESVGTFFKDNLMNPRITTGNSDRMNILRNEVQNYADKRSKHFPANVEVPTTSRKAVIVKEIVQRKEQVERSTETASVVTSSSQEFTNKTPGAIAKHSDVEQFLQTNIIVNKHQTTSVIRGSGVENLTPSSNIYEKNYAVNNIRRSMEKSEENNAKFESKAYQNPISNSELTNKSMESKTIQKEKNCNKNQEESQYLNKQEAVVASTKSNDVSEVIASTVIIKDKSMEISKGVVSSSTVANAMDLDDVVLERASPIGDSKHSISYCSSRNEGPKRLVENRHSIEKLSLVTDVSIEKVTNEFVMPPKLIKLASLKRKNTQEEIQQRKTVKRRSALQETNGGDIVVIEDEEKIRKQELDYNQNNVTKTDTVSEKTPVMDNNPDVASKAQVDTKRNTNMSIIAEQSRKKPVTPIIEDISSDEEVLEPFRLYSTYENKVPDDPRKILQTTEVSHCTLIEGNVKAIQNANRHLFEKPPVYTRPVIPRNLRKPPSEDDSATRREPLANMVQFTEDSDTLTCSLKVKNSELKYPSTIDVRRFSPGDTYQVATENSTPRFSPNFKSPPRPTHVPPPGNQRSPLVPTLPVVQMLPAVPGSPVVQTSPMIPKSPVVQTSPIVLGSPVVPQMSPIVGPPPLNESDMNWRHWFSEEQKKGIFNFERSHSMESSTLSGRQSVGSDYCSKLSPEEPLCEIKIDSKPYKIKKSLFEKIPRGKLCYIRESNTFVRYFDDNQMELFISNLNLGEGSTVASDLLKQIRSRVEGPSDIERSTGQQEASGKGEVVTLSKDVVFSTEDFLSDPELYVEEVEKVQRYVPKDFYGFYKFVTGYQIVNHHPPISFQTFLTMHNTNGIRGLFKNYVNTLAEGRNIL